MGQFAPHILASAAATRYHDLPNPWNPKVAANTMAQPMPPIGAAVGLAYRDVADAGRALTKVMAVALVFIVVSDQAERLLLAPDADSGNDVTLAAYVIGLVQTLLITPFLIAVHRYIVLGETMQNYVIVAGDRRTQGYFLCWAVLSTLAVAPAFLPPLSNLEQPAGGMIGFAVLGYLIGVMLFGLRLTLLFPAIAVDAPGATVANALADARGHLWRIFATGLIAGVPLMTVAYLAQAAIGSESGVAAVLVSLVRSIAAFGLLTQFVAISSRLYMWIGERVSQP